MNPKIIQYVIFSCFMAVGIIYSSSENNEVSYLWVFRVEIEKREINSAENNNIYQIRILVNIIAVRQPPPQDDSSDFCAMSNECLNGSCGNHRRFFKDLSISYGDGSHSEETTAFEDFEIDGFKNS